MAHPGARDVLQQSVLAFVGTAAFPRLAYRLRWPTRLRPPGLVAYIAANTLLIFAIRTWLIPYLKRRADEWEGVEQELREQLGREPQVEEVLARLGITLEG